jgi:hypothetical protein
LARRIGGHDDGYQCVVRRLVDTPKGILLIDRNGPYGSLHTFGEGGWQESDHTFHGRDGLAKAVMQAGIDRVDAYRIASDYWDTWDSRVAQGYYAEARAFMRASAILLAALVGLLVGAIKIASRRSMQ